MKWKLFLYLKLCFYFLNVLAISLKCYSGVGSTKIECPAKAKYCAKVTLDAQRITSYTCLEEPQEKLGLDKSTIKETLACYKRTVDPLKGEYCYCTKDDCNDPKVSTKNTLKKKSSSSASSGSSSSSDSSSSTSSNVSSKNSTVLKVRKSKFVADVSKE